MSRVSHLPKNVPSKEIPLKFKAKGSTSKFTYEGDFVVKVPSVREYSRVGVELARLNDGMPLESLDKSTASINNAVAFLTVLVVKGPAWFVNSPDDEDEDGMNYGLDTMDLNIPVELFRQANKAIEKWHKDLKGQPLED